MRGMREATVQKVTISTGLFIMAAAISGCILFGSIRTQAASAGTPYKYYTSIQVQKGDTLWNIANEYISAEYVCIDDYIQEVCEINHITEGEIHSGQYLTIPYYSNKYVE